MFWREIKEKRKRKIEMKLGINGCVIVSLNPHTHAGVGV